MKTKIHNPPSLILNEGHVLDVYYDDYDAMMKSAENWEHHCTYQLLPYAFKGHHQLLQFHSMQLGYIQRPGGFMTNVSSPKDCFSFGVIEECRDKACFDSMKLQAGDIVFLDASRPLNFMTNNAIKLCVVNLQTENLGALLPKISEALYHTIKDTNGVMSKTLRDMWIQFTEQSNLEKDKEEAFGEAEKKINHLLMKLLTEQTPELPKLTKGERTVLKIRDQVYNHMDAKINIDSLAKQHQISKKTLHNSFKSLFGFTPDHFLRQLKLNLVHNELKKSNPKQSTVLRIAQKWGFMHMGNFSGYYSKLFGENPSQTLQKDYLGGIPIIEQSCVSRQEEML